MSNKYIKFFLNKSLIRLNLKFKSIIKSFKLIYKKLKIINFNILNFKLLKLIYFYIIIK